jgi:hypothetical protein
MNVTLSQFAIVYHLPAFLSATIILPTTHLGWASIRHCALINTKTHSEIPDEQLKRIKNE